MKFIFLTITTLFYAITAILIAQIKTAKYMAVSVFSKALQSLYHLLTARKNDSWSNLDIEIYSILSVYYQ